MASSSSTTPPVIIFRNAVRDSEELSSRAKLVAFVLSTYMDAEDLTCFPSVPTVAKGAGYSKRVPVQKALGELVKVGALCREIGGGHRPSHYEGQLPEWQPVADEDQASDEQPAPPEERQPLPDQSSPLPDEDRQPVPEHDHEPDMEQTMEQPEEKTEIEVPTTSQEEELLDQLSEDEEGVIVDGSTSSTGTPVEDVTGDDVDWEWPTEEEWQEIAEQQQLAYERWKRERKEKHR